LLLASGQISSVARLTEGDVVTCTEWHGSSGEFRSAMSAQDDPMTLGSHACSEGNFQDR
jgi:hypothetical protein